MADQKVSDLPSINGANVDPADLLYIVDSSAGAAGSKKITVGQFQIVPVSGGTANGIVYLDGSAVQTTNTALTFNGSTLGITGNVLAQAAATQDAVKLAGRAGGASSYAVTLTPTTLSDNRTLTLPDISTTVVGTDATQTLTNKTIESGTFTNGYTEEVATANTGATYTIDLANGSIQFLTLTDNCTFTFPTPTAGKSFLLLLKQDGTGSRTVTWPADVEWPNAVAPIITSAANKMDKYVFTADGTNWYGSNAGQNYTV